MAFKGGKDAAGRARQELELSDNPFSWSTAANVLYVDSPAGVGMSYAETKEDRHTNDTQTAADMNTFLRRWFAKFSEFQGNDFFISGESFAGVYVPLISKAVLDGNDAGQEPHLRLRGYLVGNGVTDPRFDGDALVPFAYGKSLISRELYEQVYSACGGVYWNATEGSPCDRALGRVWHAVSGLNIYDVLESCYHGHNPYTAGQQPSAAAGPTAQRASLAEAIASHRQWPLLGAALPGPVPGLADVLGPLAHTPPCLDSREMWAFLNDDAVRAAIHAEPISKIGAFDECTNGQRIHYTHNVPSMLPIHRDLISRGAPADDFVVGPAWLGCLAAAFIKHWIPHCLPLNFSCSRLSVLPPYPPTAAALPLPMHSTPLAGLRGLIFSGDHDMAVPHTGSEAWTAWLGSELGVERPWAPWHTADHQVAGYAVHYRGLVYATVRGAGHMVPQTKPAEALAMLERFLTAFQL
jgi:serine carboxypeptidase-like clade 1